MTLILFIGLACSEDDDALPTSTPGPTPSKAGNKLVEGEITFRGLTENIRGATIYVRIEDVAIQDPKARVLGEQVISNVFVSAEAPIKPRYVVEHRRLPESNSYKIRVHVDVDKSGDVSAGDFTRTESYLGQVTAPDLRTVNVVVEPTVLNPKAPIIDAVVRVHAPVERVALSSSGEPSEYFFTVTSIQSNACIKPQGYEVVRPLRNRMDTLRVTVFNVQPASANAACAQVISKTDTKISLGDATLLTANDRYDVEVNGKGFHFILGDEAGLSPTSTLGLPYSEVKFSLVLPKLAESIENVPAWVQIIDESRAGDIGSQVISEMKVLDFSVDLADPQPYRLTLHHQRLRNWGDYIATVHVDTDGSGNVTAGDWVTKTSQPLDSLLQPQNPVTTQRLGIRLTRIE